ncbi:aminotransferase class III-fold pyridoxal phosphate-dependent enzyme [Micromonospora cathayae]|uniref:Aminotransferase class III-fold pyridoxal phosphate-dependent enzyme n=1 Tax=Micromonospora cathayae TaxID=3028804 RepID=A0ABY7ZK17_9ACTN|nr:aminotransferase class III-fold pyridoxal phosphate-dependent enzyme [Micromonospora sp. HUAS 3]WDZ83218.1 aminotransferase class III-fold pyridoxal phosphate-dependent enzyme [Micromonospora sp. HUAS 3]
MDFPASYAAWHGLSPMTDFFRDSDPGRFLVAGSGSHVTDAAGRRYLDARSSMWNLTLGHSCEPVKEAMRQQLDVLPSGTVLRYEHPPAVAAGYAARLAALLPDPLRHVRFGNTGSQMTEQAAMLSRFHRRMTGQPERRYVVAVHNGYHGTGPLATALTGEPILHEWSAPVDAYVRHVTAPTLPEILALVDEIGPDQVTAVLVEPVLGSAIEPVSLPFLTSLISECRARDVHVILDEVTTGAGRTGTMTVTERLPVAPDMVVLGKGLSAGYFPLAALVVARSIFDALADPPLRLGFPNGSTTDGHPIGMAAGLAVLDVLTADGFLAGVRDTGRHLVDLLASGLADEPAAGPVVGEGMMLALGLAYDDGEPWSVREVNRFRLTCRDHGLLTSYAPGFLPLMPPLTLSRDECAELVDRLRAALGAHKVER